MFEIRFEFFKINSFNILIIIFKLKILLKNLFENYKNNNHSEGLKHMNFEL